MKFLKPIGQSFLRNINCFVAGLTYGFTYYHWHNFWMSVLLGTFALGAYYVVDPMCRIFWFNHLGGKEKYERRFRDPGET